MGLHQKYLSFRTDMADERVDTYKRVHNLSEIDGVEVVSKTGEGVITTTVNVLNENGAKAVSKEVGKYVTMEVPDMEYLQDEKKEAIASALAQEIKEMIGEDKGKSILVVGLGNVYVTPDALGPKVVQSIEVTRHLLNFAKDLVEPGTRPISAIAPGVLGTTGIETSEIVTSVAQKVQADAVIVIDSLASGSVHRIGKTIQISNTGITPGAGVRNKREGINQNTLGVPVIAIGVPTVVDMATITNEAIDKMLDNVKHEIEQYPDQEYSVSSVTKVFDNLEKDTRYDMIANVLDTENYIVTPKEIDNVIETVSSIISGGMNVALQA